MKFGDWRAAALVVVLVLGAWMAWLAAGTPRPLGADASPGVFSAGRAMVDDSAMAAKPHPIGSAEAGLVRSYLIQRMQAMVPQALKLLKDGAFTDFGHLLHESWILKRGLTSGISKRNR